MDDELVAAKLVRSRLYVVNAMCCMPTTHKEQDMRKAATCCKPALLNQLAPFDEQTPVFAMGKWAMFGMTGKDRGIASSRGFVRPEYEIPQQEGSIDEAHEAIRRMVKSLLTPRKTEDDDT